MSGLWVKVCGVTREEDLEAAVEAGVDAVGLNRVPDSPRCVSRERARELAAAARGRAEVVLVVANLPPDLAEEERRAVQADRLQLHGDEPDDWLLALPAAYRAIRVRGVDDLERARRLPGGPVLLDAWAPGVLGGTGRKLDTLLVAPLARERAVILAGGLTPENVGEAVRTVRPAGVDVASGVEQPGRPGVKDAARIRAFVTAARAAGA